MGGTMAGQPLQRWSTGGPRTVPGSGSLVDDLFHGRPTGEPATPGRCQLLDPPPVQGEVIWWTSHSIGGPLVDQPLQGLPTGGPATPGDDHWWTLHHSRVRSAGGAATPWEAQWWPAAPGEVRLWSTRTRGDSSIVQQLQGWPSGRSTRQTLMSPCSQATPLEA